MSSPGWGRWGIVVRVLAAALGGYVVASVGATAVAMFMPWCFGWSRAEGVLLGTLLGFVFYVGVGVWVFGERLVE